MKPLYTLTLLVLCILAPAVSSALSVDAPVSSDARPPEEWCEHSEARLAMGILNTGLWGDPWDDCPSFEWPSGSGNDYAFLATFWTTCFGSITPEGLVGKYASLGQYGGWEFSPSEGYPLVYQAPGPLSAEYSVYGADDWDPAANDHPYGLRVVMEGMDWTAPGFDGFLATEMTFTHHSEHGNPGVPLHGLLVAISADLDVASADTTDCHLDDLVFYDGHAIWCNDPDAVCEYIYDDGVSTMVRDAYTFQQNPDHPLPSSDPENIRYYYNYYGADGILDDDVNGDWVSDHFTILAKIVDGDTTFVLDDESGVLLFSEGMPARHWYHTVADTVYLVTPRNLSYMWDSDSPGVSGDDSGEPFLPVYCNGFVGWRLIDCWVVKADRSVERPIDVSGVPIPLSHQWWNWEEDPGTDEECYDFSWGLNPDSSGRRSGPAYLSEWVGDPLTPEARLPENPGPYPFVRDNPIPGHPVFDYRFLLSLGPFTLEDGDSLHIVGGWVAGLGLEGLRRNADLLLDAYYRDSIWGQGTGIPDGISPEISAGLLVAPNPVRTTGCAMLRSPSAGSASLSVYDLCGRVVVSDPPTDISAGENALVFDVSDLRSGIYFVRVETGGSVSTGRFVLVR